MSKLTAIHKQIAALQARAERITKQEMSAAVAKVKSLMSDFGVTIEHLTQSVVGKTTAKKSSVGKAARASKKTASIAKYADPKSGKTWSGFGRAPGWIAGAKNRDDFLIGAVKAAVKPAPSKKAVTNAAAPETKRSKAKATAGAKPSVRKTAAPKAAAKKKVATKSVAAEKAATKPAEKAKTTKKKPAARKATGKASTSAPVESAQTAA
jgi:DNA-binding protein H-NS